METLVLTLGKRIARHALAAAFAGPLLAATALAQQPAPAKAPKTAAPAKNEAAAPAKNEAAAAQPAPEQAAEPEKPKQGFAPLKWIMKKVDFATDVEDKKPDFIEKTRPPADDMKYIGIGEKRPERALKVKSQAEAKTLESQLANKAADYGNLATAKPQLPPPPTLPPAVIEAQQKVAAEKAARAKLGTPVAPAANPAPKPQ